MPSQRFEAIEAYPVAIRETIRLMAEIDKAISKRPIESGKRNG
jgi:hypothetical protein